MPQWFSFVRSQEGATASVSVDVGIDAARVIPSHPTAFLLVRRIEDGAEPEPMQALEDRVAADLAALDVFLVATLTMSGSRTLIAYGAGDAGDEIAAALSATDVPFAIHTQDDPQWDLYRTLLPSEGEMGV